MNDTVYWRLRFLGCELRSDLIGGDYMRRWVLRTPIGMLRIHHILRSDDDRHFHDHPMDFVSFIVRGGYVEHRPGKEPAVCQAGSVVVRRAEDLHALKLLGRSAWTLVFTGPVRRRWGFQTEGGWIDADVYAAWRAGKHVAVGVES